MPKSAKKKKVINSPKKRVENKANSKVMKGGVDEDKMEVSEAGGPPPPGVPGVPGGPGGGAKPPRGPGVAAPGERLPQPAPTINLPIIFNGNEEPVVPTGKITEAQRNTDHLVPGIRPARVEDLISFLIESTPEERRQINAEHYNNLYDTVGETDDLLSQVLGDPGGGFLKRIFNLGDSFPYDKLRNFMLGGSSNITQCNQTVGSKDETMRKGLPCIWCGAPLDDASECEHVLPVVAAALLLTFSGGPNPELKTIIEWLLEYGWSHQLCNQVKSNDLFIGTIDLPLPGGKRERIFVPDFNVLVERFYKVVKTNNSKCWSPTPRTNPTLSKQVRENCIKLLADIAKINQGHMVNASRHDKLITGGGIAFMEGKPRVYPANLFLRKHPDNTLGNLNLEGPLSGITQEQIDFPKGQPTKVFHWLDELNLGIKGHPIVFLFNICRYLNLTKRGLLEKDKTAQQEALTRFFIGIRPDDLLSILSNTTESLVNETLKAELVSRVNSILVGIQLELQTFKEQEVAKQRSFLDRVIRLSSRRVRNNDEIIKVIRKRAIVFEKTFKVLEKDLKRIKKTNKATYDTIIMSFNQNSFPKSLNEFKTYVSNSISELMSVVPPEQIGQGRERDIKTGGALTAPDIGIIDEYIRSCFANIFPIINLIITVVSKEIVPRLAKIVSIELLKKGITLSYNYHGITYTYTPLQILRFGEFFAINEKIFLFDLNTLALITLSIPDYEKDTEISNHFKKSAREAARKVVRAYAESRANVEAAEKVRTLAASKSPKKARHLGNRSVMDRPRDTTPEPSAAGKYKARKPLNLSKVYAAQALQAARRQRGRGRIRKKSQKGKKPMKKKNPTKKKKNTNKN